jgi:hypothetical protein
MTTFVVVALHRTTRDVVANLLKSMEIDAVLLASLGELRNTLEKIPACGILLDLTTAITASAKDKRDTKEFLELYPSTKFRLAGEDVVILGETLEQFGSRCRQFVPRKIRTSVRETKYLAVYLSTDETFKDAEKTVTANISDNGCFVYSVREWEVGSCVWLRFLGNERAIRGDVCSVQPWGNNKYLPGIGIRLDDHIPGIE